MLNWETISLFENQEGELSTLLECLFYRVNWSISFSSSSDRTREASCLFDCLRKGWSWISLKWERFWFLGRLKIYEISSFSLFALLRLESCKGIFPNMFKEAFYFKIVISLFAQRFKNSSFFFPQVSSIYVYKNSQNSFI